MKFPTEGQVKDFSLLEVYKRRPVLGDLAQMLTTFLLGLVLLLPCHQNHNMILVHVKEL